MSSKPNRRRWTVLFTGLATMMTAATITAALPALATTHGACSDVVMVLDESGSVGSQEDKVREASSAFLGGLANNGPHAAIVEFGTRAVTAVDYTPVTDETMTAVFDAYLATGYDSPSQTGAYTNWDDALTHVRALNDQMVAPLVLFVTDGDPTAYNRDGAGEDGGVTQDLDAVTEAHARAVAEAELVKAQGSHLLAIGVGNATNPASLTRLKEIAGPVVYDGSSALDPFATDVVLAATFAELGVVMHDVALAMCADPGITIRKDVDTAVIQPGDTVTYTIVVRNTGNIDLHDVMVSDPTLPACDRVIGDLAVDERYRYTCTTQLLVDTTNVATVTGEDPTGTPVSDDDDAVVVVVTDPPGTGTPGYWKNHPDAWVLLAGGLMVGDWNRNGTCDAGETCLELTAAEAMAALSTPPKGDATFNVARPLVAAWLNVLVFNESSCIVGDVNAAVDWLLTYPMASEPDRAAWQDISATAKRLDDYNNGRLCAPHRDTVDSGDDDGSSSGAAQPAARPATKQASQPKPGATDGNATVGGTTVGDETSAKKGKALGAEKGKAVGRNR